MINKASLDLIKEFEGFRASAYQDSVGVWTIGYGTTGRAGVGIDPKPGMKISEKQAEGYLLAGVEKFAKQILPLMTREANENEFGAMVSLAYNIGPGAFKKSSVLRHFNAGNKLAAADAFLLWNKAGGKVLKGLERRRAAERALFLTKTSAKPAKPLTRPEHQVNETPKSEHVEPSPEGPKVNVIRILFASIALTAAGAWATIQGWFQ